MTPSIPTEIDLNDDANVAYWREQLGVTLEQLEEAVQAAGVHAQDVREHFMRQGSSAGAS